MANNVQLPNASRSAAADAVVDRLDAGAAAGYLRIYDGTQAVNANTAVGAQVLLAELRFSDPAFGAASNGVATANAITADASANATGTATWFRALDSDSNVVFDGSVGTASADLILNATAIQSGAEVSVTAMTYTHPAA